jgi:uncharacterized membrane-anchored protein
MSAIPATNPSLSRQLLNKVPEVTIFFWLIKIMATTVGETAADFLNENVGLGLTVTSLLMSVLLIGALAWQFTRKKYIPSVYWLAVVLISIVGTLITDNLTDGFGVPLLVSTIVFGIALILTFAAWFSVEKTLSIHTIFTRRRESFYWGAILFTFALGTAAGDYVSEEMGVGYAKGVIIFGGLIAVITALHYLFKSVLSVGVKRHESNAVLAFWLAYILTRPLGASIGDLLTQPSGDGGLGLGTNVVTAVFTISIVLMVALLSVTKLDVTSQEEMERDEAEREELLRREKTLEEVPAEAKA